MVISGVKLPKQCQAPECVAPVLARGYCCKHYYQVKRHGTVQIGPSRRGRPASASRTSAREGTDGFRASRTPCTVRGCKVSRFDTEYCRLHYIKMRCQVWMADAAPGLESSSRHEAAVPDWEAVEA